MTTTIDRGHRLAGLAASAVPDSRRTRTFGGSSRTELLGELADMALDGDPRPVLDRRYDLDQTADAHRALEAGGVHGGHVIAVW